MDDAADARLVLGLGLASHDYFICKKTGSRQSQPSLTLTLHGEPSDHTLPDSSSLSNTTVVKRERETAGEEAEIQRPDEDDDGSNGRKKLRLTKAQSALLEQSFKHHTTLNPNQKLELARDLKLRPRQVEVWFQNRRARTKLKQTEINCEFLKRCCESLADENRRLHKELQELKSMKVYMQLPAATPTVCPSCERIAGGASENSPQSAFAMAPKPPYVFSPSAAC